MSVTSVKQSLKNSGRHRSMDAPLADGETSTLYDVVRHDESPNPESNLIEASLKTEIHRALDTLPDKEADIVKMCYGLGGQYPMSLVEIGETFGLTRERVRQIREKAIRKLRHTSRNKNLKQYLG